MKQFLKLDNNNVCEYILSKNSWYFPRTGKTVKDKDMDFSKYENISSYQYVELIKRMIKKKGR